jgi:hypothetical protein
LAPDLKAQLDGLPDSFHKNVQGLGLGMTAMQLRNRPNIKAGLISLNDNVKLLLQVGSSPSLMVEWN